MEDGEKRSQSHSVEYDWLVPELAQNTQGRYILVLTAVLITPVPLRSSSEPITLTDTGSHYQYLERRLL